MILNELRRRTASLHQRVEDRVDILSPTLTPQRYVRILQAFQAFFEPCEELLDSRCPAEYHELWQGRRRAHRLRDDLAVLGAAPDPFLAESVALPDLDDPGRWLGALYVMEGSTLGGQVISRELEKKFGWSQGRGYSFFLGHAGRTREAWKQVTETLQSAADKNNQILEGARQTFVQLERCLNSHSL